MALSRRTLLLLATSLAVCLLAVLGVWSYDVIVRSTAAALDRAESFAFRRMRAAQRGDEGAYRFLYVTNRRPGTDDGSLDERFGNEREDAIKLGYFDTVIEPTLGPGMIVNPTEWFQNREIQLVAVNPLARPAFVEAVRGFVRASPYRSLLVVVHGYRETFPTALRRAAFLGYILDIDTPVLLFDWPGDQGPRLRGYRRARQVAEASGAELAHTLELVIREIRPERLWLLANSMGGEVVASAFSLLLRQADFADAAVEFEDVVLTAPDVGQDDFDRQFKREVTALTRRLTVYVSSNDRALLLSRLVNRQRRLGESTLSPDLLDEAVQLSEIMEPGDDRVTLVDVTPVNRTRNFHDFSLETPEFFDDLYLRITGTELPRSRLLYRTRAPDGTPYWVLTRGR